MNAPLDRSTSPLAAVTDGAPALSGAAEAQRETSPAADDKICWIEVRQSPYPPNQQVELLHLQAEAEALLLQLQALHQRRPSA
ncbi:MAG TPA: hypothetical protein VLS96_01945 [Nodosilinea sp.]|nr:hypothetical protein [Nodosilinea sp.]